MDMMINRNMEQLKEAAKRDILAQLGENWTVKENEVTKNNTSLTGITFIKGDIPGGPTIYAEDLYHIVDSGIPYDEMVSEMATCISESAAQFDSIRDSFMEFDFEKTKSMLRASLIGTDRNKDLLSECVHREVCPGLALIAYVVNKNLRARVTVAMAAELGASAEKILDAALENSVTALPPVLSDMGEAINGFLHTENLLDAAGPIDHEVSMYVLSNREGFQGACSLFFPGIKERICDLLEGSFYALPSSLHEFIIVPAAGEKDPENLFELVYSANRSGVVEEADILTDGVFICRPGKDIERYIPKKLFS